MKKHIPNFITTLNLFSGCIGILIALQYRIDYAAYFILLSAFFDFLDGMAARVLHVKSEIGKELDSLADVVSFGVLPGIIIYQLMAVSPNTPSAGSDINIFSLIAFIIPVLSAVRLAKFNIDTRQTTSFIGLPVPANAIFLGSIPLIKMQAGFSDSLSWLTLITDNYYILAFIAVGMSLLLVSEIPLISLKFRNLKFVEFRVDILCKDPQSRVLSTWFFRAHAACSELHSKLCLWFLIVDNPSNYARPNKLKK